jgi:hypothetical protein
MTLLFVFQENSLEYITYISQREFAPIDNTVIPSIRAPAPGLTGKVLDYAFPTPIWGSFIQGMTTIAGWLIHKDLRLLQFLTEPPAGSFT